MEEVQRSWQWAPVGREGGGDWSGVPDSAGFVVGAEGQEKEDTRPDSAQEEAKPRRCETVEGLTGNATSNGRASGVM